MQAWFRKLTAGAAALSLATGGVVALGPATPAGATITASAAGTVITVELVGDESIAFGCNLSTGETEVNGQPSVPAVSCASVTQVKVNGDAGAQVVDGTGLNPPTFSSAPTLRATMGDGNDTMTGTKRVDVLSGGKGSDLVIVPAGPDADSISLDGFGVFESNTMRFVGTSGADQYSVSNQVTYPLGSPVSVAAIMWTGSGGTSTTLGYGATNIEINGGDGNDTITMNAPKSPSITGFSVNGEGGDDTIDAAGISGSLLLGGPGANTLRGSTGPDMFWSTSDLDTIEGRGGGDEIVDTDGARSGGRVTSGVNGRYQLRPSGDVGTIRVRPSADAQPVAIFTSSGNRPGQRRLDSFDQLALIQTAEAGPTDLTLYDVVMVPGTSINVYGKGGGLQDLADITVPVGTWTRGDELGATRVMPHDPSLTTIGAYDMDEVAVHGPWTDLDEGFVHRSIRDLLYTFIGDSGRAERTAAIKAGTQTHASLVDEIMGLDNYRGFDVDRAFLRFLRRGADPTGKAYWINSIKQGKALWRFRAQLFGSNEYFAKAGGTNAAYVTKAYTDVLGRTPDPSGQAYWTNKLDHGANRGSVALQFINSAEARRRLVDDQYLRFLDRLPTTAESNQWVPVLPTATGEQQLVRTLALSDEYLHRS